jgi:nucleotide-binding universal stress UspA family protein
MALALARPLEAHVEAFHVSVDPRDAVAFVGEGMTAAMIEQIMSAAEQESRQRSAQAQQRFEAACAAAGAPRLVSPQAGVRFSAGFVLRSGREDELVAERGRLADLIVVPRPTDEGDGAPSLTLESCLRETGRPVLVVPPGVAAEQFGKRIAVGWNGSIEAGRAVAAGLPFLTTAERVVVLSVEEGTVFGATGADVVEYLAWHGIPASAEVLSSGPFGAGKALLAGITAAGSDMLVMGAYTRSHMRRLIFGGVTAEVLANTTIPVLMVH